MSHHRLVVYARDPTFAPLPAGHLQQHLFDTGLLGAPLAGKQDRYLTGPDFLRQIIFLGCAPNITLDPGENPDDEFCHIRLPPAGETRLLTGSNTRPPRCPACRTPLPDWQALLRVSPDELLRPRVCPHCQTASAPATLEWRKTAAVTRAHIDIWNIHPQEAIPADPLLAALAGLGAGPWNYCYLST